MSSKPISPHGAACQPPRSFSPVSVRGCTWVVATVLCGGVWLGIGGLVFG